MLPKAECGSCVTARSPSDTMPTGLPPSMTGNRRNAFSRMRRTASSTLSVGANVVRCRLQMSLNVRLDWRLQRPLCRLTLAHTLHL